MGGGGDFILEREDIDHVEDAFFQMTIMTVRVSVSILGSSMQNY